MPYSKASELPEQFSGLPENARRMAMHVINSSLDRGLSEERAFASAWGAVKKHYHKNEKGEWLEKKSQGFDVISSPIEYKSENGKYYTEGFLEVSGDVDSVGDICTEHCIDSIVNQLKGQDVQAFWNSTETNTHKETIKVNLDHEHLTDDRRIVPRGKIVDSKKVFENGKTKAWIKTQLNENHPEFKNIWGSIEDKYLDAYSMEFHATDVKPMNYGKSKRMLNDVKITGVAFTGRPVQAGASMTDFYCKSMAFEEMKMFDEFNESMRDTKYKEDYDTQRKEHPDLPEMYLHLVVKDHLRLGMAGEGKDKEDEKCSKGIPMEKTEEKKSETVLSTEVKKEEIKAEVKKEAEEAKSKDMHTLDELKSLVAEEVKKQAEEIKSKVLVTDRKEEKKSAKTFFDQLSADRGWKK